MSCVSFFFSFLSFRIYHIQLSTERKRRFPLRRCPDAGVWLGTRPGGGAASPGTYLGAQCEQAGGESLAGLSIMAPRVIPVRHEQMVRIV